MFPEKSIVKNITRLIEKFFENETTNGYDAYSSATQKAANGSMSYGTFHTESTAAEATTHGITFPVKISKATLESLGGTEVTDSSNAVDIATTMRKTTSTFRYSGKQILFQSPEYSYYILSETPSYYKSAETNSATSPDVTVVKFAFTNGDVAKKVDTDAEGAETLTDQSLSALKTIVATDFCIGTTATSEGVITFTPSADTSFTIPNIAAQ